MKFEAQQKIFIITYKVEDNPKMKIGERYSATITEKSRQGWQFIYDNEPWSGYIDADEVGNGLFWYNKGSQSFFSIDDIKSATIKVELQ